MMCSNVLKNFSATTLLLLGLSLTSCSNENKASDENADSTSTTATTNSETANSAEATINGTHPDTTVTGTVRFNEENGRVKMTLDITAEKMANKSVAVHLHEHGDCGDMGKGAHGHWNPTKVNHGKWGSASFHVGDIGNINLNAEGKGTFELETDLWTISGTDSTKNILNKAVIVHGGVDDYTTQPTGNAGTRIGCGVISKKG